MNENEWENEDVTQDMTVPPPLGAKPQGNKEQVARDAW